MMINTKRYNRIWILFLVCSLVLGTMIGCGARSDEYDGADDSNTIAFFVVNTEGTRLMSENIHVVAEDSREAIVEVLGKLLGRLGFDGATLSFFLDDTGILSIYFGDDYKNLSGTDEVLYRAAIVKTMCEMEAVSAVSIYVDNQPLMKKNGRPVGLMTADSFVDNTDVASGLAHSAYAVIYYANEDGTALVESQLKIYTDGSKTMEQQVVTQLLNGPLDSSQKAALSPSTVVSKVYVQDGTCFVDFGSDGLIGAEGIEPKLALYSIVNSLCELGNIYNVQFLINGNSSGSFGDYSFSQTFERDLSVMNGDR